MTHGACSLLREHAPWFTSPVNANRIKNAKAQIARLETKRRQTGWLTALELTQLRSAQIVLATTR